jgi:2-oxoglutarate ferredoxin oxidoreductase subunit beta
MNDKKTQTESDIKLTKEDFTTDQEPRWCIGCGDYAVLSQVRKVLPELGIPREKYVFVAGIGCSSRFPYYMDTYGFHSIHGRALPIASGIKINNPDLSVWVVTGDGDAMSMGGNHFIHFFRRNLDINVIMFNNQIYGLTKGQYSPTSEVGKITSTSPQGSIDRPINPVELALASGATFIARTLDRDQLHMAEMFKKAAAHKGSSFIEVYQNCNIFNDGAFFHLTEKDVRDNNVLYLQDQEPLIFGKDKEKIIRFNGLNAEIMDVSEGENRENVQIFEENQESSTLAFNLAQMTYNPNFPTPVGIFLRQEKKLYEQVLQNQVDEEMDKRDNPSLEKLLHSGHTWQVG